MGNFRLKLQIEMARNGWINYNKDKVFQIFLGGECQVTDSPPINSPPIKKPQQVESIAGDQDSVGPRKVKSSSGDWWQSSALAGSSTHKTPTPGGYQGEPTFQGWRERKWFEDDDSKWSYSTGLGTSILDI